MERSSGTVKWFSQEKGFGFVTREDGSDVFVHHSGISGRGFKTLEQGERVEFEVIEEPKGLKAANLVRLDAPEAGADGPAYGNGNGNGRGEGFGNRDDSYGNRDDSYGNRAGGGYGGGRGDDWGNRGPAERSW